MTEQTKSELVDDHGKLVYQSSQVGQSKQIKLKAMADRLPNMETLLSTEAVKPIGHWEEVEMPDTLDLAERAALSVNALIGSLKPDQYYACTQTFRFGCLPPNDDSANWGTMFFLWALPYARAMCGSQEYLDVECAAMKTLLKQIGEDGKLHFPELKYASPEIPGSASGRREGSSWPNMSGVAVLALLSWHERDSRAVWHEWARILADGLKVSAVFKGDYAYIPPECGLTPEGKWEWTLRYGGKLPPGYIPYNPPEEPTSDQQGLEGCVKGEQAEVMHAMVRCYELFGDTAALEHARKLVKFCLKPCMWEESPGVPSPAHEHGIWAGHFYANISFLQSLLAFAVATEDERLKQFVRRGYEHALGYGVIRFGFMPSWLNPANHNRPLWLSEVNEAGATASLLLLAVEITDAGLGDYWDDVDSIIRNHLIELQIRDLNLMKKVSGAGVEYDETFKRIIGDFSEAWLTCNRESWTTGGCTANGARSLYVAWEGITRFNAGVATVNLFLNRVSPWIDVHSYLPYQGKVVLHNKQAHTIMVRIPYWVDTGKMACFLNDRVITPLRAGNHLIVKDLKNRDTIRLEFPVRETVETYIVCGTRYTATFRGSTVVDITPRDTDTEEHRNKYPFFKREHLKASVAPMRKVRRFVAEKLLRTF